LRSRLTSFKTIFESGSFQDNAPELYDVLPQLLSSLYSAKKKYLLNSKSLKKKNNNEKVNDVVVIVVCFCFVSVRG